MPDLFDPVTIAALLIGLVTGLGFLVVAAALAMRNSRRLARRLQAVKDRKSSTFADRMPTRSLARRESATPRMDQIARRWLPRRDMLIARLERTGRTISLGQYMMANAGIIVALATLLAVFTNMRFLPGLLLAAGLGIAIPHLVISRMGKRRIAAFIGLFPDAIDLMVRALRSGLPISEAVINAAQEIGDPVGTEFRTIEAGMRLGRDLDSLLWEIARRINAPEFRFFIIALSVQRETGGNLAETLGNLADVLRRRRTMRAKARAMMSEARASTAILGSLPLLVSCVLLVTSPNYILPLFSDIRGLVMCAIALGMLGTGIFIMTKMARFEI
jgi:tight adherence protein B